MIPVPARPPLALAHGAGGGIDLNFATVIERLAPVRDVRGVDYPGSGATRRSPAPLELDDLADRLVAHMVDASHERFPVLGMSLGSAVAVTAAARHPDRVTGLVLTVGFARSDAQVTGFVRVWRRLAELGEWDALAEMLVNASPPAVLETMDEVARGEAVALTRAVLPSGGPDQAELAARVDVTDGLGAIRVPTLVVVAGQDRIVLPQSTRDLAAGIAGSEVVEYPEAGHVFTPAEAVRWSDDVADFLLRHDL